MKLNTNTWHYKLWKSSYRFNGDFEPNNTDLCRYCHRVFWQIILCVFVGLFITYGVSMAGFGIFKLGQCFITQTALSFNITGLIAVILGVVFLYMRWLKRDKDNDKPGIISEWMKARKERFCPMVEFEEDSDVQTNKE